MGNGRTCHHPSSNSPRLGSRLSERQCRTPESRSGTFPQGGPYASNPREEVVCMHRQVNDHRPFVAVEHLPVNAYLAQTVLIRL